MSKVTNIILSMELLEDEDEKLEEVNIFFKDPNLKLEFYPSSECSGDKNLEADICIGAYNYMDIDGFCEHLDSINWSKGSKVQLFVKDENSIWKVIYENKML